MIGQLVGNYKVISQIGVGGMGEVFLAEHTAIGTRVAIKVLMAAISQDQEQVDRFFNEARAVNKVKHAGPVKIFDVGYHIDPAKPGQRQAYLVMEFLDGESLAGRIRRLGTLPGDQVSDIGRQIAGVLDAVHTAGITHRDLKPDNIFLVSDHELPSGERVKVLDFGIAKLTGTMSGGSPKTKGTMGTPAYMAPEQWNNAASVDGRADTYSLGCVMFEMAVGKPPFPSQSIGEACNHHLNSKPPRTSAHMRSVPPEFDNLVDRMLAKQSDQRPSIKEVARTFDELRNSGAMSRWTAAMMVSGFAQTMAPNTPLPQHFTPPQYTPQHQTPQHQTPQHHTPQHQHYTPQHHMAPPPSPPVTVAPHRSKKGLVFALVGIAVVGAGAAVAITQLGPGSGSGSNDPGSGIAIAGSNDAKSPALAKPDAPIAPAPSLREQILAKNPFVDRHGVSVLTSQITAREFELVMGTKPPVPIPNPDHSVHSITQAEAKELCTKINARLPTSDEWSQAAKGAWGIGVGSALGPLQEWTSTLQDELVVARGGHEKMD